MNKYKFCSILLLFIFFNCSSKPPIKPPTAEQLANIMKSMNYEAEDRWANWDVKWKNENECIQYRVALYAISNEIAMNGYINLIKELSFKHAPKYDIYIILSKMGKNVKTEWIYSRYK